MGDGKALQMGTSHELGQNFARVFGIQFSDESGAQQYAWQTSWGVSTRLIGAVVMAHGDDFGLRLPPAIAPLEVVVLAVRDEEEVRRVATGLVEQLGVAGRRARLDDRTGTGFGRRSVDWELKGVPVRVEVGPRDLAAGNVTVVTRHRRVKEPVPLSKAVAAVSTILDSVAGDLRAEAGRMLADRTVEVRSLEEAIEAAKTGFARLPWAVVGEEGEERLAAHAISVRCLQRPDGSLADDLPAGTEASGTVGVVRDLQAVVGRAY